MILESKTMSATLILMLRRSYSRCAPVLHLLISAAPAALIHSSLFFTLTHQSVKVLASVFVVPVFMFIKLYLCKLFYFVLLVCSCCPISFLLCSLKSIVFIHLISPFSRLHFCVLLLHLTPNSNYF